MSSRHFTAESALSLAWNDKAVGYIDDGVLVGVLVDVVRHLATEVLP